jgi:hypothetical protein
VNAVEDTLKTIMAHALRVNPTNPMWLRTQADIYFGMLCSKKKKEVFSRL